MLFNTVSHCYSPVYIEFVLLDRQARRQRCPGPPQKIIRLPRGNDVN